MKFKFTLTSVLLVILSQSAFADDIKECNCNLANQKQDSMNYQNLVRIKALNMEINEANAALEKAKGELVYDFTFGANFDDRNIQIIRQSVQNVDIRQSEIGITVRAKAKDLSIPNVIKISKMLPSNYHYTGTEPASVDVVLVDVQQTQRVNP